MAGRHLLSLKSVTLAFGGPSVLEDATLNVFSGDRICVTGRNGEGKSTLLKVLSGDLEPDSGEIVRAPGLKTAFLRQEVPGDMPGTAADVAGAGGVPFLSQLGVPAAAPFNALSGGMRRRAMMAQVLGSIPDLVLLDEPTNHLDIESIEWLEAAMRRLASCAFVFVTHDRAFLKKSAATVFDLDGGRLSGWNCDYATFVRRKRDLEEEESALWEKKAKKLAVEEAWIRRGVKARTVRNQGRVAALMKLRAEFAARRTRPGQAKISLDAAAPGGERVIKIENLSFSWPGAERPVVRDFTADILRGERIGVIGRNGAGKTTLLNLLCGRLSPSSGKVTAGTGVKLAFFDQLRSALDPAATVASTIASDRDTVTVGGSTKHVYAYLADFLFTPERSRSPVGSLSGGERARLMLARLFLEPCNLLVMDEPTNDLDVETLELLEERLMDFPGTILLVSHDRTFLDNVVTSTFVLEGDGTVGMFPGGYADWQTQRKTAARARKEPQQPAAPSRGAAGAGAAGPPAPPAAKKKLSFNEKRELDALPDKIDALEKEIAADEAFLADPSVFVKDAVRAAETAAALAHKKSALDALVERWADLSERL